MQVAKGRCTFLRANLVGVAILGLTACGSSAPAAATLPPTPSSGALSSPTTAASPTTPTAATPTTPTTPATPTVAAKPTTLAATPAARATTGGIVIIQPTAAAGQVDACKVVTLEGVRSALGTTVSQAYGGPDVRTASCSYTMTDGTILIVNPDAGDGTGVNKAAFKRLKGLEGAQALSGIGDDAFQKPGSVWVLKGEKLLVIYSASNVFDGRPLGPRPPGPFDAKLPVLARAAAALL